MMLFLALVFNRNNFMERISLLKYYTWSGLMNSVNLGNPMYESHLSISFTGLNKLGDALKAPLIMLIRLKT